MTEIDAQQRLIAPYPWFGGKSRVSEMIWQRFGDPDNFCEPFFGSGAVLLGRPSEPKIETINDIDCAVSNFWRAIKHEPEVVTQWADWPVNEADLLARHRWLVETGAKRIEKLRTDPDFYDVQVAGWWVHSLSMWIGGGFMQDAYGKMKLPHMGGGEGIHKRSLLAGNGYRSNLQEWFQALSRRLRHVRVACGDWSRILGPSVTTHNGVTAVLADPPYASEEHVVRYAGDALVSEYKLEDTARAVRRWCIENGDNPELRIALCGYYSESYKMPEGWTEYRWKAAGGYGNQGDGRGRENSNRECVWFSPHCLKPGLMGMLGDGNHAEILPEEPQGGSVDWPVVAPRSHTAGFEPQAEQPAAPPAPARRGGLFDLIED